MPTKEFDKLKEALKKPVSKEAMEEAAKRFKEYEEAKRLGGKKMSRPMLVSLGLKKPYPTEIEIKDIPDELERNPALFELMKKIITKGEK